PCPALADTGVTLDGSASCVVTPVAFAGPPFDTVIAYVSWSPTFTGSGESCIVTATSVRAGPAAATGPAVIPASTAARTIQCFLISPAFPLRGLRGECADALILAAV